MPCYSRVETKLVDLEAVKAAAADLGMRVEVHSKNIVTVITQDKTRVELFRTCEQDPFKTYNEYPSQVAALASLTRGYATAKVKAYAKKNGYMVARGSQPGEYVLTSYK